VALVVALARLNAYRRLCLLCAGCVCGLAWVLSFALLPRPSLTLAGAIGVALALPVCFGAVLALEAARVSPSSAPRRLPFVALVLLPVASVLLGPWAAVVGSQLALGAQFAGLLLSALLALLAIARVLLPLLGDRREALARGLFASPHLSAELAVLLPWLLLTAAAVASWSPALLP